MKVVDSTVVRRLCVTPEEADELVAEGKRPPTQPVGVRVTLDCGTTAFWSFKWRTVSVTYPRVAGRYKHGGVITDSVGCVVYDAARKNAAVGVVELFGAYGAKFALLVMGAVAQAERDLAR